MAEVVGSDRSLRDIAAFYRGYADKSSGSALNALGALVDHIAHEYGNDSLFCWTSVWSLCISQHHWTSPQDWMPYLRVEPTHGEQIEFRYHDSLVGKLDWVRIVPPEGVVGRFDAFVEQLHWRPTISDLRRL